MTSPPSTTTPLLYLIDGSAYVYRAFFALPVLTNSKGLQTNAVYGFATMLMKIVREHRPQYLGVVFDEKGPTVRHEEFVDYKANRPEMPGDLQVQLPYIHRVVEAFRIPLIREAGLEADDLIGSLARQASDLAFEVVIVTSDKDMFQLLSPSIRMYDPVKTTWYGEQECRERFGVEPARVVDVMGLMGDASDNIPGVKGIGEKTAKKLIAQFGSLEELLSRVEEVSAPKTRALLTEQADQARLSKKLATILVDSPVSFDPAEFEVKAPDEENVKGLFRELEFPSLLKNFQGNKDSNQQEVPQVQTITDVPTLENYFKKLTKKDLVGVQPLLGSALAPDVVVRGLILSSHDHPSAYISPVHSKVWGRLQELFNTASFEKGYHDMKPACRVFLREGGLPPGPYFDTMVADYLLNPNRRGHSLETLALDFLGYQFKEEEGKTITASESGLFTQDEQGDISRAAESAWIITGLVPRMKALLKEQGCLELFEQVEMPLVTVLAEIEQNGFALDVNALRRLGEELDRELGRMMETITELAGETFNVHSPKQLAVVLFEKLGLTPLRKTKTGYSTDEDTLTQLASQHDLPAQILNFRSVSKLKSTYVDALPALVNAHTGRLHTTLHQTVAATGRLSSTDPNLQNIPVKGEYGLRIREAFVASKGHTLLCADYSQIEPRVLAHFSQDVRLREVFEQGKDIHTATAVDIFHLAPEQISRDMRRIAKTVVFGILYGISPYGLSQTLGITQQEAKKYIDAYFARYSGVRSFMDQTIQLAKAQGYTTTILGRRRPIPELRSSNPAQRGFGERMAVNSPIQGSAADIIKMAMLRVHRRLPQTLPGTSMILQVHDELIFEVPNRDIARAKDCIRTEMEAVGGQVSLTVPLQVEMGTGLNWKVAHP